jgi:glucose-6-phosphate isomerase
MNKEKSNNFVYEDEFLSFESYLKDFTKEKFKEFSLKANKIGLNSKIKNLMNSKIVNETENQAALHPEYREMCLWDDDASLPDNFMKSSKNYNFGDIGDGVDFYRNIEDEIHKDPNIKVNIISIGIGGSLEGPKLMLESNTYTNRYHKRLKGLNFDFLTGPDSNEFKMKVDHLDPKKTFFVVFSKSFETIETIEMLKIAIKWSGDTNKFLALTSNLEAPKQYGIFHIHTFDKEIGGRYSIWLEDIESMFGGRWMANGRMLTSGGSNADVKLLEDEDYFNFVKYLSFSDIWMNNFNGKHTRVVLSYIWNLRSFPDYVQQLEMESLGKPPNSSSEFKKTGQIIFGGYGPKAEHSYLQLLHQGTQDICADIIACKNDEKDLEYIKAITQAKLLSEGAEGLKQNEKINGNVHSNLFLIKQNVKQNQGLDFISEETLGYLIATWEHRTYITAVMLGINPFDQFGVSAGKIFTKKYLEENGG